MNFWKYFNRQMVMLILVLMSSIVLTTGLSAKTVTSKEDRRVVIVNHTSSSIYHFYASNVDRGGWEDDILGASVIPPGRRWVINIDDGTGHCYYDFKAVLRDGRKITRYGVNVCTTSSWTLSD